MSNIAGDKSEVLTFNYEVAMAIFPFESSFKNPVIVSVISRP